MTGVCACDWPRTMHAAAPFEGSCWPEGVLQTRRESVTGHKDDGRWHTSWYKAKFPEVPSNAVPVLYRQVSYVLHQSQTLLGRHLQPSQMSSGLHQCSNSFWRAQLSLEHNHFVIFLRQDGSLAGQSTLAKAPLHLGWHSQSMMWPATKQ